jgi:hypothetical protein
MIYVLVVLSGVYSVASTATVGSYRTEQACKAGGESYVAQAAKEYPADKFHFICVAGESN